MFDGKCEQLVDGDMRNYIEQNRIMFFVGIVLMALSGLVNVVLIGLISTGLRADNTQFFSSPYLFVGLLVLALGFGIFAQWILEGIGHNVAYQMREYLLKQILQSDPEKFQNLDSSKIHNAFSKDIPTVLQAIKVAPYTLYGIFLILGGGVYMLWLSWSIAIFVFSLLIITIAVSKKLVSLGEAMHLRDRELQDSLVSSYVDIVNGHKELALNEPRGKEIFDRIQSGDALESKNLLVGAGRLIAISSQLMGLFPLAAIGLILWGIFSWGEGFDVGVNFAVTLLFIRQPIGNLVHQVEDMIHARIALKHLFNLDLAVPYETEPAKALCSDWNKISVTDLYYKYANNEKFLLGPIDMEINRGEIVFLVGSNGAGKSTLLKLLCGLQTPLRGNICIDGLQITQLNRREYRAMFSAVLSDFFLFDNVSGLKIDDKKARNAVDILKQLELQEVVSIDGGVFSSINLSTGQRKRLALLVALMDERLIMVLDEWAADQDPKFRKVFYEEILPQLKLAGITLIVISHDDRYLGVADRLIGLENGKTI